MIEGEAKGAYDGLYARQKDGVKGGGEREAKVR